MTIGVTGSAGFLGANLLSRLRSAEPADAQLVAFYSARTANPLTAGLPLRRVHLDVTERQEVFERTRGLDVLFHLAGKVDYARHDLKRTWDINVLGARNVFDAALANRIGRVIYVSSISVLGTATAAEAWLTRPTTRTPAGTTRSAFATAGRPCRPPGPPRTGSTAS